MSLPSQSVVERMFAGNPQSDSFQRRHYELAEVSAALHCLGEGHARAEVIITV
jgi:hypothetical protein